MRIAICDDENRFISDFIDIVNRLYSSLDIIVDEFPDGTMLLKNFGRKQYDIVFLDIEMPGLDGISLAGKLRELSEEIYIVFLTGHVEYALKGYGINALRYLTKPASERDIREVIDYVIKKQHNERFLWVKTGEGEYKIRFSDIVFIEAQDQKIIIYAISDRFEIRGKLNDYENRLKNDGFFRIHRSYIVSLSKVTAISGRDITVAGGTVLPVGRTKEKDFRNALMSFVNSEAF